MIVSPRTHTHTLSVLYTFKGLSIRPQVRLSFTYIQILVLYQRVSHAMASIRLQIDIMVDIILTAAHCGWQTQTTTLYTAYAARQYAPASAPTRPSPALGRSNFSSQTPQPPPQASRQPTSQKAHRIPEPPALGAIRHSARQCDRGSYRRLRNGP